MLSSKGLVPLLLSFLLMVLCLTGCAQDSNILDNGGNRQLEFSVTTQEWNNSNSSSDSDFKKDSRATPISGNTFDTSKNFNIITDVNKGESWFTEVNNETASYSTTNKIWQTSKIHYWPGTSSTVNFYVYYPTSISSKITYNASSVPVLSYTVPDKATDQIDILTYSKTDVAGDSYNQTPVDFKHIFAAVKFSVGSSGLPVGTITKITLNNILYKGTYCLDGTWTLNTADKKSFSQTVSSSTNAGTVITSEATTFMMMPQILDSDASITITYSNGGILTKAITGTWEAGKTYTYNLSYIPRTFDYTGAVQTYTVPVTGTYKLEVWGAQGFDNYGYGGKGGYSYGDIFIRQNAVMYVCVGGQGTGNYNSSPIADIRSAGYNGGGYAQCGGGGATHIAFTNRGVLKNYVSNQDEVLIVAGGGGGSDCSDAGSGGGVVGSDASESATIGGNGGTQSAGGNGIGVGSFGQGGCMGTTNDDSAGAGGGGWYGGGSSKNPTNYSGGGGSGHLGSTLVSGTTGMQNGVRSGDGYARITFVSAN